MTHYTDTFPEGYDPIRDGGADYGDDQQPDYDYLDDDEIFDGHQPSTAEEHDLDAYQVGYAEGYRAGKAFNSMSFRLYRAVPYAVRNRWYAIRRRLFPNNSDIPF